jgi:hypothetical protein
MSAGHGLAGKLADGRIPEVLRDIYVGRLTGLLHFSAEDTQCALGFSRGRLVGAVSDDPELRFGESLVRDGMIGLSQLVAAEDEIERQPQPLGQALVRLGFIDQNRLEDLLELYVREVLVHIFSWESGEYRFEEFPDKPTIAFDETHRLSTAQAIQEAVRGVLSQQAIHLALGDLDRTVILSTDPLLRFQKVALSPTDGFVLSRIDGVLTMREILDAISLPAEDVERALFALLCTGLIELLPPQQPVDDDVKAVRTAVLEAHARLHTRTHFEVLGIKPDADTAEVRAAYYRLAKTFHPDVHHRPELADLRDKLDDVFARIAAAYDVLSHQQRRQDYESLLARTREPGTTTSEGERDWSPERALEDARQMIEAGRVWEAVGLLQGAVPHAEGRTRTQIRLLRARTLMRAPEHTRLAEEELKLITREAPDEPEGHYLLGKLYKQAGLTHRAASCYRRALELKPNHRDARLDLADLGKAP